MSEQFGLYLDHGYKPNVQRVRLPGTGLPVPAKNLKPQAIDTSHAQMMLSKQLARTAKVQAGAARSGESIATYTLRKALQDAEAARVKLKMQGIAPDHPEYQAAIEVEDAARAEWQRHTGADQL